MRIYRFFLFYDYCFLVNKILLSCASIPDRQQLLTWAVKCGCLIYIYIYIHKRMIMQNL